jgi:hypothetical protein
VKISTVEVSPRFYAYSRDRLACQADVEVSRRGDLPLGEEIAIIIQSWKNAVIMIDDFQVPGDPGYGFDDHGPGKELIRSYLPRMPGWRIYFPAASSAEETGSRRGCAVLAAPDVADAVENVTSLVPGDDDGALASAQSSARRSAAPAGELAVTYDGADTDGVGSQLQLIYGLWALSRDLDVKYVHTPIRRVGYQGLMPLLS